MRPMQLQFPNMSEQFTKADRKIIEYITNNTEMFLFSSIGEFAKQLDLSEATVSRFVRHVGCRDYKELKRLVMRQNAVEGPAAKLAATLNDDTDFSVEQWFRRQQQYLEKTLEGMGGEEFDRAAELILSARRIFIHAKSASASMGQLLFFRLRRLGFDTVLLPSGGSEVLEGLVQAQKGDVVIMFSFSKVSAEGRIILRHEPEAGYRTVSFSSRTFAPQEERADVNLYVYRGEEREYHTMTAAAALVDALVVALSRSMGSDSARNLTKLHRMKKRYM